MKYTKKGNVVADFRRVLYLTAKYIKIGLKTFFFLAAYGLAVCCAKSENKHTLVAYKRQPKHNMAILLRNIAIHFQRLFPFQGCFFFIFQLKFKNSQV